MLPWEHSFAYPDFLLGSFLLCAETLRITGLLLLFTGTEFGELCLFSCDFTYSLILAEDKVIFIQ